MNTMETDTQPRNPTASTLPPSIQQVLEKIVELAREIEPYIQGQGTDSIYIDYRQGSWTRSMLEQFQREIYPYAGAVALLQFAAENAGVEVNYRAFLQNSSLTDRQVRSELGAMSKVARRLFGKKVWPVRTRQGSDGVTHYFMPEGIAEWWLSGTS